MDNVENTTNYKIVLKELEDLKLLIRAELLVMRRDIENVKKWFIQANLDRILDGLSKCKEENLNNNIKTDN